MNIHQIKQYISYILFSSNYNNIAPSPYIHQWISAVLNDKTPFAEYQIIKSYKNKLSNTKTPIETTDYGSNPGKKTRTIDFISKKCTIRNKYGIFLFKLAKFGSPRTILELGSSIGISASWMALAAPQARITSIEGCPEIAKIAQETAKNLNLRNIEIINEQFDNILPQLLTTMKNLDLVYIDGNHTYKKTMEYFYQLLPFCHKKTILVFDDIHWSKEMSKAWKEICSNKIVRYSIDIQQCGIVFFEPVPKKETLVIRY